MWKTVTRATVRGLLHLEQWCNRSNNRTTSSCLQASHDEDDEEDQNNTDDLHNTSMRFYNDVQIQQDDNHIASRCWRRRQSVGPMLPAPLDDVALAEPLMLGFHEDDEEDSSLFDAHPAANGPRGDPSSPTPRPTFWMNVKACCKTCQSATWLAAFFVLYASLESVYFVAHVAKSFEDDKNESGTDSMWILELCLLFVVFCIPFTMPLHRALGFASSDRTLTPSSTLHARLENFLEDAATNTIVWSTLVCAVIYSASDICYFTFDSDSKWKYIYPIFVPVNILTIYFGLTWGALTAQAIIVRLKSIEEEAANMVDRHIPENMSVYSSFTSGGRRSSISTTSLPERWLQAYRMIRTDFEGVCNGFGYPFLFVVFCFTVEVSSSVLVMFEQVKDSITFIDFLVFLAAYLSNAYVLCSALSWCAFIQTQCSHRIGPKFAMLAMRHAETPQYIALASTFLHAPIKLHVGNFELSPEYSNTLTLWFFSLLLLLLGLRGPGAE